MTIGALYLRPSKEGLDGVGPDDLFEMVYGLANAPRLRWRQLRALLLDLGLEEMTVNVSSCTGQETMKETKQN